ncbi:MAG: NfeD family protein [Verrucomicrobiota bacterium]
MNFLRRFFITILLLIASLTAHPLLAQETSETADSDVLQSKNVYVVPVRGDIDSSIIYVIRRGVKAALEAEADALVLHMDTYGGRVDITQDITDILRKFEPQSETYTYIDTKAISAGAFISSATRHIYMAPGSVIGAATPVMMAPGGGAQQINESYEEKIQSALKALVRANAELHGHNPVVFDAMIDRDQGLKIGDDVVVEEGKVLTLTSMEAGKSYGGQDKPLLSSGTVKSLDDLITRIGGDPATAVRVEPTGMEQIATFIVSLSTVFIAGAVLFGYIEFKTPGIGIFGALAAVCAGLFFFGHSIAGLSGHEYLVLMFIGVVLIAIEIFLIPGTVISGFLGLVLVSVSLLLAMADTYPTDSLVPSVEVLMRPAMTFGQAMLLVIVGIYASMYFLPKTRAFQHLVLDEALPDRAEATEGQSLPAAVGAEGIAMTPLHPGGKIEVDGTPIDAFTEDGYIDKGTAIKIMSFQGTQALVEKV